MVIEGVIVQALSDALSMSNVTLALAEAADTFGVVTYRLQGFMLTSGVVNSHT